LLKNFKGADIYETTGEPAGIIFLAGMAIDADGAPNAYGPSGTEPSDYLANAGSKSDCWGMACDSDGNPYVRKVYHPYQAYYVSTISLQNAQFPDTNPDHNLNSVEIPFIVLPTSDSLSCQTGDLGLIYNINTDDNTYIIVGNRGPNVREAIICAARCLSVDCGPKTGMRFGGSVSHLGSERQRLAVRRYLVRFRPTRSYRSGAASPGSHESLINFGSHNETNQEEVCPKTLKVNSPVPWSRLKSTKRKLP
jgi:hypothetical protein